jgi:hypothetical protein
VLPPTPRSVLTNRRAFLVLVRNELWRRVRLVALDQLDELEQLDAGVDWGSALDGYYADHDTVGTDADARSAAMVIIDEAPADRPGVWTVRQILADPAGDHDWAIRAEVDLEASEESGAAVVRVLGMDRLDRV